MGRNYRINIRLNESENEDIKYKAKMANMNVSDYIREIIFLENKSYNDIQKELLFYSYSNTLLISHLLSDEDKDVIISKIKESAKKHVYNKFNDR